MSYYPLSKITPNLYTSGNEFKYKSTSQNYKGYYFSAYDGKYYTEKAPNGNSVELIKYVSSSSPSLASLDYRVKAIDSTSSEHYIPTLSVQEYTTGYITRYFIKRVNGDSSTIKEISKTDYTLVKKDPLYISTSLLWKLTGNLEDVVLTTGGTVKGVIGTNTTAIKIAEKSIPNISQHLINTMQFYKG